MNEMTLLIPLGHVSHMKLVMALFPWSLCCSVVRASNSWSKAQFLARTQNFLCPTLATRRKLKKPLST